MNENDVFDAEALIRLHRAQAVAPSPCGTWLAAEVRRLDEKGSRYVGDLWRVPLDGTTPRRLTRGDHDDGAPCFRYDGSLGFLSDRPTGRDEDRDAKRRQVWVLPADGGEPEPMTDEPLGVLQFRFASAGDRLALLAPVLPGVPHEAQRETADRRRVHGPTARRYDRMTVRHWDHWLPEAAPHLVLYDAEGGDRRDWTPGADREHRDATFDVSADGRRIVITAQRPGPDRVPDRDLLLLDTHTGETCVLAQGERVTHDHPSFSPDGTQVACDRHVRSEARCGMPTVHRFPVAGGEGRLLTVGFDGWCVTAGWTADGSRVLFTADHRGATPVFAVAAAGGPVEQVIAPAAGGQHTGVIALGHTGRICGLRSRFVHPPEPFVCDAAPGSEPEIVARLSGFQPETAEAIATIDRLEVPLPEGHTVQTWVVAPTAASGPAPTFLWIHGGPMSQWSDGWHWRWNALVPAAAGYVVVLPNPSGSTGFGSDLLEAVWGNRWGDQCHRDVMAVADAVAGLDAVDGARMVAMGGSFGGYMTNWLGGNTGRFRALVTHASIYQMSAFHGVTDYPAFWIQEMGGVSPYTDPESYDRWSPHRRIAHWTSPTLVIHGEKDYRVPIGEALALFEALQSHGVPSELIVFPDEGHWILRPRNVVAWYEAVLEFVSRHTQVG